MREWLEAMEDPVRAELLASGRPDLDAVFGLFPRPGGDAAFEPSVIAHSLERLRTSPEVDTGHPLLDLSVKTGLVHIDACFQGDHPKYGVKAYGEEVHDGFPPTIVAAVDALTAWGLDSRAEQLFVYWIQRFVREDGTVDYYGTSVSEYGQLLHTAAVIAERVGLTGWWRQCFAPLDRLAGYAFSLRQQAKSQGGLIFGVPEADTRGQPARYFHNNAWMAKGLARWADLCDSWKATPTVPAASMRAEAGGLARDTLEAIAQTWPQAPDDWWLSPCVEPAPRPRCLTDGELASYTNYRYWPELLSSDLLPRELSDRLVEARLRGGGQFCGMTRFLGHLDDWPLADYLHGLWVLGRRDDFLLSLYGHISYHQAEGHLTAYEQVTFPPGKEVWPYCLPCQLVAARAARVLVD